MPTFEKSLEGYYIVRVDETRAYAWEVSDYMFNYATKTDRFVVKVIHNFENRAMVDVHDTHANAGVARYEVNPLDEVKTLEWVVDRQVAPTYDDVIMMDTDEDPQN
jgi:hypothetical protein